MARGYKSLTTLSDGHPLRRLLPALVMVALITAAAGCGEASSSDSGGAQGTAPAPTSCPAAWAAGWQAWTNRIGAVVYCPTFFPAPLTPEIDGQWMTAK